VTYADTSGLVKLLIAEAETTALGQYLSGAQDGATSSELAIAELNRTVARAGADAAAAGLLLRRLDLLTVDERACGAPVGCPLRLGLS